MKTIYHVPTEQYGFIELEMEKGQVPSDDMIKDAVNDYRRISEASRGGEGMSEPELDIWVYNMLLGKGNNADVYQKATPTQQKELHRIKRALAKIKRRNGDETDEEITYHEGQQ